MFDPMTFTPPKPLRAMERAAASWGSSRLWEKLKDGKTGLTCVSTTRCLVCGKNVPQGRGVEHALAHVRAKS